MCNGVTDVFGVCNGVTVASWGLGAALGAVLGDAVASGCPLGLDLGLGGLVVVEVVNLPAAAGGGRVPDAGIDEDAGPVDRGASLGELGEVSHQLAEDGRRDVAIGQVAVSVTEGADLEGERERGVGAELLVLRVIGCGVVETDPCHGAVPSA